MRWLVTGAGGMLGHDLVAELVRRGEDVTGLDRTGLDTTAPSVGEDLGPQHPGPVDVRWPHRVTSSVP